MAAEKFYVRDLKSGLLRQCAIVSGVAVKVQPQGGIAVVDRFLGKPGVKIDEE